MHFTAKSVDAVKHRCQSLVISCYEGGKLSPSADAINTASAHYLEQLIKRELFQAKAGQTLLLLNPQGLAAERLVLVGLGAQAKDGSIGSAD